MFTYQNDSQKPLESQLVQLSLGYLVTSIMSLHGGKGAPLSIWLHPSLDGDLIIILVTRHLELSAIF